MTSNGVGPARPDTQEFEIQDSKFRRGRMNLADLNKVAKAMTAPGKGILAADESTGTIKKRFTPSTPNAPRTVAATIAR